MTLTELSIKQPVATMMLFMAVVLIGIFSFLRLNLDLYPEIEPPAISVITIWPGASASDVETEVTEEIEARLNTVNNLDTLRSRSLDNLSIVSCLFEFGSDLDAASNDIRDMLDQAKMRLPDDAESPMLFKFSSATTPILFMSFTADKSYPRLFHIIDKEVGDELKRVQGVGGLIIHGGLRRQINIYFDIKKIEGFHLSLYRINQVMAAENLNIPAGIIKYGKKDFFVRVPARYKTIEDIRNTVIGTFNNKPVYLRDVANVEDDYKTLQMYAYGNGKPGLVMMLQKQSGTNTVEVIERVKKRLNEISKNLPSDIKLDITTDASEDIIKSVKNLRDTLLVGLFLVVVVTVAFLRQIRTAFIIVIIIPFAMITAFILIYAINYTLNMVTLMALAVASGMVVDDGIVVIENIVRHIERGRKIKTAATLGANEMWLAITTSTMTTVVVFIPLMFATGIAGIIFKPLAFVVTITLLSSLMIAIMLTPMMASKLLLPTS